MEEIQRLKQERIDHEEERVSEKKSIDTMQEIIQSLTEKKLSDATKIEELKKNILDKEKSLKEMTHQLKSFNEISLKNETLNRQLKRLSDENENLTKSKTQSIDLKAPGLGFDAEEQNEKLNRKFLELTHQNDEKSRENKSLQCLLENNSIKIKKLIQENSELKETLEMHKNDNTNEVKIKYDKCIKKLKVYREKILDISEKFKLLKADREILMTTTREYSESVSVWQKSLAAASLRMIESIRELNEKIKVKDEEIQMIKDETAKHSSSSEPPVKHLELEIQKLNKAIQSKDIILADERETLKKLKQAVRNKSLLDLEMQALEKTLEAVNKKLEDKKQQVMELENTVQMQTDTLNSFKSQITTLEATLHSEKQHSSDMKKNLDTQLDLLRKSEHERTETKLQLEMVHKDFEALKLENSEIKFDNTKRVEEMEKRHQILMSERDGLINIISQLENDVEKFKKLSENSEKEIGSLKADFASYKLRAQGVLRQSQTKDLSREQELQDEIVALQTSFESFKDSKNKMSKELESLKKSFNEVREDNVRLQVRCKDLVQALERQSEEALEETRKRTHQHDESIKAYQFQIDTLNSFFKKKLQETELCSSTTISELQAKIMYLEKSSSVAPMQSSNLSTFELNFNQNKIEEQKINLSMMDREEAEGSEDQSSQSSTLNHHNRQKVTRTHDLIPLDELLNSSFENNWNEINEETVSNLSSGDVLERTKLKLAKEENRVQHLTALLADSEKDLAKIQQMNDMLKEEVRRQQRNFEREEHIQNSEYLKNIVIKFVTLNNGDEKQRLIPVINTILKLSSEENNLLQNACKSGWW